MAGPVRVDGERVHHRDRVDRRRRCQSRVKPNAPVRCRSLAEGGGGGRAVRRLGILVDQHRLLGAATGVGAVDQGRGTDRRASRRCGDGAAGRGPAPGAVWSPPMRSWRRPGCGGGGNCSLNRRVRAGSRHPISTNSPRIRRYGARSRRGGAKPMPGTTHASGLGSIGSGRRASTNGTARAGSWPRWQPRSGTGRLRSSCGSWCCRSPTRRSGRPGSTCSSFPNACTEPASTRTGCTDSSAHWLEFPHGSSRRTWARLASPAACAGPRCRCRTRPGRTCGSAPPPGRRRRRTRPTTRRTTRRCR